MRRRRRGGAAAVKRGRFSVAGITVGRRVVVDGPFSDSGRVMVGMGKNVSGSVVGGAEVTEPAGCAVSATPLGVFSSAICDDRGDVLCLGVLKGRVT